MREIKFRAWDTLTNQWYDWDSGACIDYEDSRKAPIAIMGAQALIFEQYIGLKDRNDREIYEGDIVIKKNVCSCGREISTEKGKVLFHEGEFTREPEFFLSEEDCYDSFSFEANLRCEVIGNIHENPELLKG